MNQRIVRVIVGIEYVFGAVLLAWSLYLISGPLHPAANDSHSTLPGVFSGLILLSFSLAVFIAARAMRHGRRTHWLEQSGVILLCLGLFAVGFLSRNLDL
jgi:hypothetical protein